jgi:hypothetical protein
VHRRPASSWENIERSASRSASSSDFILGYSEQAISQPAQENKHAKHRVGDNRLPQSARRSLMAHERDAQSPKNK